jgi:DNA polymerase (family 10)
MTMTSSSLSNQKIAEIFARIADAMEARGDDRFKYQAYRRVSETLAATPVSLHDYHARKALREIEGVGPAIASKIAELLETGKLEFYERLRAEVPDGVVDVLRVPGVGPKTAWRLYQELGITTLESLEAAARSERIRTLKGLGAKLEQRILQGLEQQEDGPQRYLLGEALPLARDVLAALRAAAPSLVEAQYAGSLRRASPTIGDLDLVGASPDPARVLDAFVALPYVANVERRTEHEVHVMFHDGKTCSLLAVKPEVWGAALVRWTGSAAHRERLEALAADRGLVVRSDGVWRGDELLPSSTEVEVYAALDLPFIPPELRENWGEIEAAQTGTLPSLVTLEAIQGDLHTHTAWSDGHGTVAEVAAAAQARGYRYYAITDHGVYMGMVNGLDHERLKEQRQEIDAVNADLQARGVDFRLLQGIEVDILPDGTLALSDEVLETLDWVVASLHVSLRQDRATVTERLLGAVRNPHVDCIGHPTGRLLLRREGADLDMDVILDAAAQSGVVMEVDGSYPRLDLDAEVVKHALERGIKIAIDSDAHHPRELNEMVNGVATARRGWATPADVVNTWSWDELEAYKARRTTGDGR